jgi:DNA-binding NarL/FixJ family response regulator
VYCVVALEPVRFQQASRKTGLRDPRLNGEISVVRILVADDSPAIRRCLRGLLDRHDDWLVCDEASNGKEAVERFVQARPDLIVIDFQMPEMNGLDAARLIVNLSPNTPILMVTVHLSKQLSEEARKVGIRGACAKADISSVVDAVGALLREETYFPSLSLNRQPGHS